MGDRVYVAWRKERAVNREQIIIERIRQAKIGKINT